MKDAKAGAKKEEIKAKHVCKHTFTHKQCLYGIFTKKKMLKKMKYVFYTEVTPKYETGLQLTAP